MQPAAVLSILVDVQSASATAALRKFDKTVVRSGTNAKGATDTTSRLDKATGSLGRSLGTAARYAAGAAAAYLSVSQARAAVTTTQELANTSAVLARNLGLSTKQASRWASVAQTRDISTRQMNASFATLTQRLTDAKKGTEESVEAFRALGVTQKDLDATGGNFQKQLLVVADALDEAKGGAARQDAAITLLGRGYQTLLPIMGRGSEELREQLSLGDKYGATMGKNVVATQMNLTAELRESQRAWQGLQVTFTSAITPALQTVNKEFQNISRILASDRLTDADKFRKVSRIIGDWAEKALSAFIAILPKLAEEAAEAGPRIALALGKGFINASIWGKLFAAGWLITKMGGLAMFRKSGERSGKTFGRAFGPGMVAGLVFFGPDLLKEAFNLGKKAGDAIKAAFEGPKALKGGWSAALGSPAGMAHELPDLRRSEKERAQLIERARKEHHRTIRESEKAQALALTDITEWGMDRVNDKTKGGLDRQENKFKNTRDRLDNTTKAQASDVAGNATRMVNAVGKGLKTLGENTNSALKAFGAKKMGFTIKSAGNTISDAIGKQRGGPINQGKASGDSVPAMLERGEYVLNRNAVRAVGKNRLDAINFGAAKRFQTGGVVEALGPVNMPPFQYDANHAGSNRHLHLAMSSPAAIVAFGKRLQQAGFMVGEHPAFGGVQAQHAPGGYHYSNQAIDINTANDETVAEIRKVVSMLGGASGSVSAQKLKRLILEGPAGPLREMGQSALDRVRKAGNKFIASQRPTEGYEGATMSGSGEVEKVFARVAKQLSTSKTATLALGMAGYAESGMRDLSYGHSSSQGALQLLASTAAGLGVSPHDEAAIASLFFQRGFYGRGGANSLAAQGLPAHLVAQGVQGSAFSSGSNYLAQKGPAQAWMRRYGLQRGGLVQYLAKGGGAGKDTAMSNTSQQLGKMRKRLNRMFGRIGRTDERISIAEQLAGLDSSPSGSDLSSGEKAKQIKLQGKLLDQLQKTRAIAKSGVSFSKKTGKPPGAFRDALTELQGLTGKGGRIFDTKLSLNALRHTQTGPFSGGMSISALLDFVAAANYGAFSRAPVMHSGGVVPGPIGSNQPIIAQGGETVIPLGGNGSLEMTITNWDEGKVLIRRQIGESDRAGNNRYRVGVPR